MTKEECLDKIAELQTFATQNNLTAAIVFFPDAIIGDIQCRYIYAPEYVECSEWVESVIANLQKTRKNPKPSYAGYIGGVYMYGNGLLFTSDGRQTDRK